MKTLARGWLWALGVVALLAPFLANDVPLVASIGGSWRWPAFEALGGGYPPAPDGARSWKRWWSELPDDGEGANTDWAFMPPWPYGPFEVDSGAVAESPSIEHVLGTDAAGRDVLARLVHGTRTALVVGLGSALLGMVLGTALGAWGGFRGGWVGVVVLRLIEVFQCYPAVFMVLAMAALVGNSIAMLVVMLGLSSWPTFARLVRGEFVALREREFAVCARGLGIPGWWIVWRHMLPQVRGLLLAATAFAAAQAIAIESAFSFLGLGPGGGVPSWGGVLAEGKGESLLGHWHLLLFPVCLLALTTMALHGSWSRSAGDGTMAP